MANTSKTQAITAEQFSEEVLLAKVDNPEEDVLDILMAKVDEYGIEVENVKKYITEHLYEYLRVDAMDRKLLKERRFGKPLW